MDAFEQIAAQLLIEEGYWTIIGYKVDITQAQANQLDNRSMPRPEIDIVAYKPANKLLYLIEAKSFIDSFGVQLKHLKDMDNQKKGAYKLLTHKKYRTIVKRNVIKSLRKKGLIPKGKIDVQFGLIAANLYQVTDVDLVTHILSKYSKWLVWGPEKIIAGIKSLAKKGYENNSNIMIAKLLNPCLRELGELERRNKRRG